MGASNDPFAALVQEMNLDAPKDAPIAPTDTFGKETHSQSQTPIAATTQDEKQESISKTTTNELQVTNEENKEKAPQQQTSDDDGDGDDDEQEFVESIDSISDIGELKKQYIAFYKAKEMEIYELKNKFTEISRRQEEVFLEVENRRKLAATKGKKYKQTAQKYHFQTQKMTKDLEFERNKSKKLSDDLNASRQQKKQMIDEMNRVRSQMSTSSQMIDETHNVIDKLIQNEKIQETLKCFVKVDNEQKNANSNANYTNMTVVKLEFLDESLDASTISVQWNRSYFTQLIPIKNANKREHLLSADDIGSIIKVEVRSKDNPDCYETAVLKNGPVAMSKACADLVQENLVKINKQQIEFEVEPDVSDAATAKLMSAHSKSVKGKELVLHFNKDKIKLRTPKNSTIEKEEYNDSMGITLSALNPRRFSFKLSGSRKYVFFAKSGSDRDNICIFLRCYIERLQRNNSSLCEFYLRLANERKNHEIVNRDQMGSIITLTRDQLVSKILAPISSNPGYLHSFQSNASMNGMLNAPISNGAEPSQESAQYDVDQIFPDFNGDSKVETEQQEQTATTTVTADDITFDDEDVQDLEAQNAHKKAWKSLQFVENAKVATDQGLQKVSFGPAPTSSKGKKKKKKTKKKSKKKKKIQEVATTAANDDLIDVCVEMNDR